MTAYPFVQCRWRTPTTGRRIDLVVLHTAETPEGANTARAVANYFRTTDTKASAHYCVDSDEIIQTCRTLDVAYAAPGANHNGVHVELAGRASQTDVDWHDAYSTALLRTAAPLVADLCAVHRVPVRYVGAAQLIVGGAAARGITTHANVSRAFRKSTHTDPGPNFPIVEFVNLVLGGTPEPAPPAFRIIDQLEVDVVTNYAEVGITTDSQGNGWTLVPYPRSRILGHTPPGLRPDADQRYETSEVGFADEGSGCVVSIVGWAANTQAVVGLHVIN